MALVAESDFNFDYHVSFLPGKPGKSEYNYGDAKFHGEAPGLSAFLRDGIDIFHTYSTLRARPRHLIGAYNYLDPVPKGRDEASLKYGMEWVRLHDLYDASS